MCLSYLASFPYAFCSCGFLGSFLSSGPAPHCIHAYRASSQADALAENRQRCQDALGEASLPRAAHGLDLSMLQPVFEAGMQGEQREMGNWSTLVWIAITSRFHFNAVSKVKQVMKYMGLCVGTGITEWNCTGTVQLFTFKEGIRLDRDRCKFRNNNRQKH